MDEDIDIEEHDVMANSKIQYMFPDISIVKTEVLDYDYEPQYPDPECDISTPLDYLPDSTVNDDIPNADLNNVNVVEQDLNICNTIEPDLDNVNTVEQEPNDDFSNDDNPDDTEESYENEKDFDENHCCSAYVMLQDWGPYIDSSHSYCNDCGILFPTVNAFDAHKMVAHSFLVEDRFESPQKVMDDEKVMNDNDEKVTNEENAATEMDCFVCKEKFVSQDELILHIYSHMGKGMKCAECGKCFDSIHGFRSHLKIHKKYEYAHRCNVCSCLYITKNSIQRHYYLIHKYRGKIDCEKIVMDLKCPHCALENRDLSSYNRHIMSVHSRIYVKKITMDCKPSLQNKVYDEEVVSHAKPIATPILKKKPVDDNSNVVVIPKNTLFQCKKCNTNFINALDAVVHSKICNKSLDVVLCLKCNLKILKIDFKLHELQHKCTNTFNVLQTGGKDIRSQLISNCLKCDVYFKGFSFLGHYQNCNGNTTFIICKICRLKIHVNGAAAHKLTHKKGSIKDIVVEYTEITEIENISTPVQSVNDASVSVLQIGRVRKQNDIHLCFNMYFCERCNCFVSTKSLNIHETKTCRCKGIRMCHLCGLSFTAKVYVRHMKLHKFLSNFNLENFKLYNVSDKKPFKRIPQLKKCHTCGIYTVNRKIHTCHKSSTCQICKQKFDFKSIEIHKAFHIKFDPKPVHSKSLVEKSNTSIKMFYCMKCKSALHKHTNHSNSQGYCTGKQVICSVCGIKTNSKRFHKQLHARYKFGLSDIKFYKVSDNKRVKPHIPQYPKCKKKCGVTFHSVKLLRAHECDGQTYKVCEICHKKMSSEAYELHMGFHYYEIKSDKGKLQEKSTVKLEKFKVKQEVVKKEVAKIKIKMEVIDKEIKQEVEDYVTESNQIFMFQCSDCLACFDLEQSAVRHRNCKGLKTIKCTLCNLIFTEKLYEKHEQFHKQKPDLNSSDYVILERNAKETLYYCKPCNMYYPTVYMAVNHVRNGHVIFTKIKCRDCKRYFSKYGSDMHRRVDKGKCHKKMYVIRDDWINPQKITQESVPRKRKYNGEVISPSKRFQCECGTKFSSNKKYKEHIKICDRDADIKNEFDDINSFIINENNTLYRCGICLKHMPDEVLLKQHVDVCNNKSYCVNCPECKIDICETYFKSHRELHDSTEFSTHCKIVTVNKRIEQCVIRCTTCDTHFLKKTEYVDHIDANHQIYTQNCEKCSLKFNNKCLEEHYLRHETSEIEPIVLNYDGINTSLSEYTMYRCNLCNVHFPNKTLIARHLQLFNYKPHELNTRKHCDICMIYVTNGSFFSHMDLHSSPVVVDDSTNDKSLFYCPTCDLHLVHENSLRKHHSLTPRHRLVVQKKPCAYCGLLFSHSMGRHIDMHHTKYNLKREDFSIYVLDESSNLVLKDSITSNELNRLKYSGVTYTEINTSTSINKKIIDIEPSTSTAIKSPPNMDISISNTIIGSPNKTFSTPNKTINEPNADIDTPNTNVSTLNRDISISNTTISTPNKDVDIPNTGISTPKALNTTDSTQSTACVSKTIKDECSANTPNITVNNFNTTTNTTESTLNCANKSKCTYFECVKCNVLFLDDDKFRTHVSSKTKLEEYDFIECKVCKYNIFIDSIKKHMEYHKLNSFSSDSLFIKDSC